MAKRKFEGTNRTIQVFFLLSLLSREFVALQRIGKCCAGYITVEARTDSHESTPDYSTPFARVTIQV